MSRVAAACACGAPEFELGAELGGKKMPRAAAGAKSSVDVSSSIDLSAAAVSSAPEYATRTQL